MLTFLGNCNSNAYCDRIARRDFLRIGGLNMGGLSLAQLLSAESQSKIGSSNKSLIMIYMPGGPPHQDMYDIKTNAPSEIRGEFNPIKTNVPGIQICEHLPKIASIADKCVFIRSVVGAKDRHYSYQCLTGRHNDGAPSGGWPEIGSVVSSIDRVTGVERPSPPYVNLSPRMKHKPYNFGDSSFLGVSSNPFRPNGDCLSDMTLTELSVDRLHDRRALLKSFDNLRRDIDSTGGVRGFDGLNKQAFDILTSSKLAEALNFNSESKRTLDKYGKGTEKVQGDAAPRMNSQFLIARRLVEAGARVVTLSYSFWDWHGSNFSRAKENFPDFDQAYYALITDLEERGMLEDVTVIAWGEFGRSPKINKNAGRDHWPNVSCALLSGGGMQTGGAIGTTDRLGGEADERPVHFGEIFATLYNNMGIDASQTTVMDLGGRPRYLVEGHSPIKELI
ncbi:MAG: hypothetical protein CMP45_08215 [Rickettsiales bacterium]|nr:hypothetical protein [Rickettsiales bacterium]|tara:strand:+ start:266 stop:1609 length:1344 start_codon:yes stop_codon:yes gene_type:complete